MQFDDKAAIFILVRRTPDGCWDVNETDFKRPLASFENRQSALEYARDIAKTKSGSVISEDAGHSR